MVWLLSNTPLLFAVLLAGLLLMEEIGTRVRLASTPLDERQQSRVQSSRDGLTVLLSFLLGFTLPMSLAEYEARRELLIDEASAISTVDQRAQLLPDPYGQRIRQLLPQYVEARLDFARQEQEEAVRASAAVAARLQGAMWRETVLLVHEHPEQVIAPIVAQATAALGNLADFNDKRLAAYERRIPLAIWFAVVFVAVLTCLVVGYSMDTRLLLAMFVLPLTAATVLTLIAELEIPRAGYIRVRQESMLRVQRELQAELGH